jgi:hypothetical protein
MDQDDALALKRIEIDLIQEGPPIQPNLPVSVENLI